MVVTKCKMMEIKRIIVFMEQLFKGYLTYFQPTTTLRYHLSDFTFTEDLKSDIIYFVLL